MGKEADADAVHPDADAVDKIAGFAAAPEEQFFDAGEEKLEAVDSKIGRSGRHENKVEVVANARNTTLASNASPIFSTSFFSTTALSCEDCWDLFLQHNLWQHCKPT